MAMRTSDIAAAAPPADAPRLAEGIELIGEFEDSGFKEPPLLARRADGQVVQLTQLLYLVAEACDGARDVDADRRRRHRALRQAGQRRERRVPDRGEAAPAGRARARRRQHPGARQEAGAARAHATAGRCSRRRRRTAPPPRSRGCTGRSCRSRCCSPSPRSTSGCSGSTASPAGCGARSTRPGCCWRCSAPS